MLVPTTGSSGTRRSGSAIDTDATTATLPAILGHGRHDRTHALSVIDFVTVLTRHCSRVGGALRQVTATNVALTTSTALPSGTDTRCLSDSHASSVVMITALAAEHQVRNIPGPRASSAFDIFGIRTGVWNFANVVPAEARVRLNHLEAPRGGHTRKMVCVRTGHFAVQTGPVATAKCTFIIQTLCDSRLETRKRSVRISGHVKCPVGTRAMHVVVAVLVQQAFKLNRFRVSDLLQLIHVLSCR